jgi:hypothetical protein
MRDNGNITNEIVDMASDIMESQRLYNQLVIKQLEGRLSELPTITRLTETNRRITEAVYLMKEFAGSWS